MVMHRDSGLVLDTRNLGLLRDYSRNHHTLTNHGATPVRGKFGKGMVFDGVDDYIDCGAGSSLDITDAITVEVWVKFGAAEYGGIARWLGTATGSFLLQLTNGRESRFYISNGTISENSGVSRAVGLNEWHYFAGIFNPSITTISIYLDGGVSNIKNDTTITSINSNMLPNLKIGAYSAFSFNGSIASVKIYNRALSGYEIGQHYQAYGNYGALSSAPKIL